MLSIKEIFKTDGCSLEVQFLKCRRISEGVNMEGKKLVHSNGVMTKSNLKNASDFR